MELVISSPKSDGEFLQSIDFNFEELKDELTQSLEKYKGLIVTQESIIDSKESRAKLNKFKEAIESKRKEIKKKCLEPYDAFEIKIKILTSMIDEPILAIDTQIKSFEQAEKDRKLFEIKAYWLEKSEEIGKLVSFESIFDDKWLNKTKSMNNVLAEMDEKIKKLSDDLASIQLLDCTFINRLQSFYLSCFDLSKTLQEKARIEQEDKRIKEFNKSDKGTITNDLYKPADESPKAYDVRLFMTEHQKKLFKDFVSQNNIKYTAIPRKED